MILPEDAVYLSRQGYVPALATEGDFLCVVVPGFRVPAGYQVPTSDLLMRLPAGFPDAQPDMWWFDPALRIAATGAFPPNTELMENHLERAWQRWSRHFPPGQWRPGRSGIESYVTLIRRDLERWVSVNP